MSHTTAVATTALLVCFLIAIFGSSNCLRCYDCNQEIFSDPKCDVINNNLTDYLTECDYFSKHCMKLTVYERDGPINATMRKCVAGPEAHWCKMFNQTRAVCELCDTDGCNDSPMLPRPDGLD